MKKILISLAIISLFMPVALAKHIHYEKEYQQAWCSAHKGVLEYELDDMARVDCLTSTQAVEFDFANKWAESIGQALYYGIKTNKKPTVVLIMENPTSEQRYLNRLNTVAKKFGIEVHTMTTNNLK